MHIPYHFSSDPNETGRQRAASLSGQQPSTALHRVLIVEDEIFIQLDLERELNAAGFTVVGITDNADDAVRLAAKENPDVVLMDVRLRGTRDGVDAALEIWEKLAIRSIFISGNIDQALMARAAPAEPLGFVHKPFVGSHVVALLKAPDGRG
jgi:DNA-binding NarL/FixJ family response regulator